MKSVVKCFVRVLAVVCLGLLVGHAETVTWTNTAGGAWSLAANWSPNKVPVAADTAQITNSGTYLVTLDSAASVTHLQVGAASGTQTFRLTPSGSLTVTGTATFATNAPVEWTGGTLAGAGTFNISGSFTLSGTGDRTFSEAKLNTFGTTTWSGTGRVLGYSAPIWRQSGVLNVSAASSLVWAGIGGGPAFVNSGAVTFATNFTFNYANVTNLNAWSLNGGEMSVLNSNFRHAGSATLGANAILGLDSGTTAHLEGPVSAPANALRFRGADASIRTLALNTPSVWQSAGTVRQLTNVTIARYNQSGGTWLMTTPSSIGTYALTNGEFRGALLTATNVWWDNGSISRDNSVAGTPPVLIVPASGQLNFTGTGDHGMSTYDGARPSHVQVFGTFNWSGTGRLLGYYGPMLELRGTSTISAPSSFVWAGLGAGPVFVNSGSVTFATNFTFNYANVTNLNAWSLNGGEMSVLNSNFRHAGNATLGANAVLGLDSGTTAHLEGPVSAPANGLRFRGADASIQTLALNTPSVWQSAGTVRQLTNVTIARYNQSGGTWLMTTPSSIGTYALTNGEFRGALLTATNVWWNDGSISRDNSVAGTPPVLIVPASGQLNFTGTGDHGMSTYDGARPSHVQVFGTFNWSGTGRLLGYYGPMLELRGTSTISAPSSFVWAGLGAGPAFVNSGSLTFTTNFTFNYASVTNLNAWSHTSGEMSVVNSNFRHAGSATLGANAVLGLDSGTTAHLEGPVFVPANGLRFRGADASIRTLSLNTPSVWQSAGTVRQLTNVTIARYNQSGGTWLMTTPSSIGTYALTNGEFRGALLTATNVWWDNGSISRDNSVAGTPPVLIVPAGGQLNFTGTGDHGMSTYDGARPSHVQVFGTFNWSGTGRLLGYYGSMLELRGTSTISAPSTLIWAGLGAGPAFVNSGSLTFTTNFTFNYASVTNLSTWSHTGGEMSLVNSNFRHAGTATLGANAVLGLDSGTTAHLEGPVSAPANGLRFRGADASIRTLALNTPSVWQSAGTVRQLTNVTIARYNQSGGTWLMTTPSSIGTYALTNGEFRGALLTATNVWWNDGSISRDNSVAGTPPVLIVPASGQLNFTGTGDHGMSTYDGARPSHVQVFGTFNWSGTGRLLGYYAPMLELRGTSTVSASSTFVWAGLGGVPAFVNSGSVTFTTNFTFNYTAPTNSGTWTLAGGSQSFANTTLRQTAGTFSLAGGKVEGAAATADFAGGTLTGNGEFGLPFVNSGATVAPGRNIGVLQFPSFTQTTGTLSVEVGRGITGTNTDHIRVTGNASVAGKLKVRLLPGVGTNDQYVVLTTAARTGTFNPIEQPANGVVEAAYSTTNVVLNLKELFQGSAPTITAEPLDLTLDTGGSGSFNAAVTGSDPISFRWQKNGTDIDGATTTNLNRGPVAALDAAGYRLIAENDFGATTSRVARLNVRPALDSDPGEVLPIARWHLDEPAGSTVVLDVTGNRYDGTNAPVGITSIADGRAGRALQFNRTNNGHVNMGRVLGLGTNDFTVVAWVKSSPNANGFASYLSKHTLTFNNGYALNLNASGGNGQARKASWYATTPAGSGTEPRSTTNVDDGQWHQVVATHRGDGSANAIYVDGTPVEHSTPGALILTNTAHFLLGGVTSGETPTGTFSGSLDEIALFDRILSDAQIDYLFANPAANGIPDIAAPSIVTAPAPLFVPAGTTTNLAVTVTGTPPLAFQWFRNGTPLSTATNATLPLTNLRCDIDTGYYSVRITNSYGSAVSVSVMVGLDLPIFEADGFRAWYACSGRNPTNTDPDWDYLRVSTTKDTYHTNGAWFIDTASVGENLYWRKIGTAARFPTNGVIEFCMKMGPGSSSSPARGWVSVTFSRGDGRLATLQFTSSQVWFNTADLTPGTKVTTPTSDDFHTWRIEFVGTPGGSTAVRLLKDRVQVATGNMFADATRDEPALSFGEGSVLATGTSEWLFFRHTSTAGPALVINDGPDDILVPFAGSTTLTVAATGNGPLRYQWRKDNTDLSGATNATLQLTNLVLADAGTYTVLVSDDYDSLVGGPAVLTVVRPIAATVTWTNTLGGNWNVPSNWSPNLVPESSDTALITQAGAYVVTNTVTANVLNLTLGADVGVTGPTLRGGNLIFGGTVRVESLGTLEDTTVGGGAAGVLLVEAGGSFIANADRVLGAITTNRGLIQLTRSLTLNQPLTTESGGRVTLADLGRFAGNSPFINHGTLRSTLTDPSLIAVNTPFTSTGLLEIPSGVTVFARIGGSNTIAGAVLLGTNATLTFGPGDHRLAALGGTTPSGRVDIDSLIGIYDPRRGLGYYGRTRVFVDAPTNWWTTLDNRQSLTGVGGVETLVHPAPNPTFGGTNLQNGGSFILPSGTTATFARHTFNGGRIDGTNAVLQITPDSTWNGGRIDAGVTTRVPTGIAWTHAAGLRELAGTLENLGQVGINSGTTALLDGARWLNRSNAVLNLTGSTLGNTGTDIALLNEGLVSGSGNLALAVTNNGTLRPGTPVGSFTVRSLSQGINGRIELDLAAGNPGIQYDQIAVTGNAQLAGTLALTLRDGYTPTLADVFAILPHGSRSGTFTTIVNPSLATLVPNYAPTQVQLNIGEIFTPAPVITAQPVSQNVPAGAQVVLQAGVRGTEPFTFQWFVGGAAITGGTSRTLVLDNVQPGTYSYLLSVSNSFGVVVTDPAVITVRPGVTQTPIANPGIAGPLNSVTFFNSLFGFITGDDGAFRYTINGGQTWLTSLPGVPNRITGAAFYGGAWWIAGSGGLICVSYDRGVTWIPFNTGTSETFTGITFGRDGTGFAVGSGGTICVYRNGVWVPASGIPGNVNFYGVYTFGGSAWAVGSGGTICVYRNGGWVAGNTGGFGGTFYGVSFWNASFGIAVGSGGTVCISRDGGLSWSPVNVGASTDFLTAAFASGNVLFIGGRGGVLCVSTDGGLTWSALSTGTTADITSISWRDGQGFYVDANGICRAFTFAGFTPNRPPLVRILNPLNTTTLETNVVTGTNGITLTNIVSVRHDFTNLACVPISIRAEAIDPDGTALFVELFINGFSADNDFVNPTAKLWDNCTPGRYILSALGTDNLGSVGIAEDVAVTVLPPYHILVPRLVQEDLVRLCYAGDTNKNYGLEISTNLIDWTYLGPFFPTNSILQYLDGSVTNTSHRLYRAIELPANP